MTQELKQYVADRDRRLIEKAEDAKRTMDEKFRKMCKESKCNCGRCGNCGDLSLWVERFCETNQRNFMLEQYDGAIPCVFQWRVGSCTETGSFGPGEHHFKADEEYE